MITENEQRFLMHVMMFGSDGYPARKLKGNRWVWDEFFGVKGAPIVYKTKRECMSAIDAFVGVLCDKKAGRL